MINEVALALSSLGVGGLLGVFAKSFLDKRQLKFSKVFEYKEARYKAITILMLTAVNPSKYELAQLKLRRPDMEGVEELNKELELEYQNAMLYASNKVLKNFEAFLTEKSLKNYRAVAQAMRKDLYL
jgi:phosphopantetheinyl transferase (holo-ACP synthase)